MTILQRVYEIINDRKVNPKEGSYVNYLQQKGIDKICKKVGEEASEVIIAAKNADRAELIYETADLWFHTLVLLSESGVTPNEIFDELEKRFNK